MIVGEIMKTRVETVPAESPVGEASRKMQLRRIRHLVVTRGAEVVGVVSDRDLPAGEARDSGPEQKVEDVMTHGAATAAPEMPVRQAANLLRGRSIGCLPVLRDGQLVGIVTISDLLELVGKGAESPVEQKKHWTLKHRSRQRRASPGER